MFKRSITPTSHGKRAPGDWYWCSSRGCIRTHTCTSVTGFESIKHATDEARLPLVPNLVGNSSGWAPSLLTFPPVSDVS